MIIKKVIRFLFKKEVETVKTFVSKDKENEIFDLKSTYTVKRFGIVLRNDVYIETYKLNGDCKKPIVGFNKK